MTVIKKYICDLCGKEFDDNEECQQHEILERCSKYSNSIIFFDRHKKIIPLKEVISTSPELWGIFVTDKNAIPVIDDICNFIGEYSPWYEECGLVRKTTGLYLYDADNSCWFLPADKIKELKEKMKEYGVDA